MTALVAAWRASEPAGRSWAAMVGVRERRGRLAFRVYDPRQRWLSAAIPADPQVVRNAAGANPLGANGHKHKVSD